MAAVAPPQHADYTPPMAAHRSLPSSPRSSFSSLGPPPAVSTYRPDSRSSLYPSRSSPTLPALAEDAIASNLDFPVRPLSLLVDEALRQESLTAMKGVDQVDFLNSVDPFGGLWHHDSPYDICSPVPRRPASMIFPEGYSSVPFPRSRRNSVLMPSPLSQATSAASVSDLSFGSPIASSPLKRRISLDDPYGQHEVFVAQAVAQVQRAKQEKRDAALAAAAEVRVHEEQTLEQQQTKSKKDLFAFFRRKPRSATAPMTKPVSEKTGSTPKRSLSRTFSILTRRDTAKKLKRRPSEKRPSLSTNNSANSVQSVSKHTVPGPTEPAPEYKITPFDVASVSPTPTPTSAPAPVDPALIPLPLSPPPSPRLSPPELPAPVQPEEEELFPPSLSALYSQSSRPSLPSLQNDSVDGSQSGTDESASEAVPTPDMVPGTPREGKHAELDAEPHIHVQARPQLTAPAVPPIMVAAAS